MAETLTERINTRLRRATQQLIREIAADGIDPATLNADYHIGIESGVVVVAGEATITPHIATPVKAARKPAKENDNGK